MKDNKKIKDAFSKIHISHEVERRILDKTVNQSKEKKKFTKYAYIFAIIFAFCFTSLSIVYAKEIKQIIEKWSSHVELKDGSKIKVSEESGFKKIPEDALKTKKYEGMKEFTYDELEQMLGFKILKLKEKGVKENDTSIGYSTGLNNDETIGRVDLWITPLVGESGGKNICALISMLNVGADSSYVSAFHGDMDATGDKTSGNAYHLDHLDVDVVFYNSDWDSKRLMATLVYKDIRYQFIGQDYSKEEMLGILENLMES